MRAQTTATANMYSCGDECVTARLISREDLGSRQALGREEFGSYLTCFASIKINCFVHLD